MVKVQAWLIWTVLQIENTEAGKTQKTIILINWLKLLSKQAWDQGYWLVTEQSTFQGEMGAVIFPAGGSRELHKILLCLSSHR